MTQKSTKEFRSTDATQFGRTCLGSSPRTKDATLQPSSKNLCEWSSQKPPIFLCLTKDGQWQDACSTTGGGGVSHGAPTTLNFSAFRRDGGAYVYFVTTPVLRRLGFCLTLNLTERPRTACPSRLSDILETNPDPRYNLSAKACQGILNRAQRRGKELPPELKAALENQANA